MVLTMLSLLATTTVVSGAESLSSCQIPPDQLQRSWFGVTSAMSKPAFDRPIAAIAIGHRRFELANLLRENREQISIELES